MKHIGIGEEALFRGFLQSYFSELINPLAGLTISSLLFGGVHILNATHLTPSRRKYYYAFGLPLITLGGFYYGWMTQKNHPLQESVALHTWYDFSLRALSFLGDRILSEERSTFSISLSF